MSDEQAEESVKAGEFRTGCLYRTNKPFSSREFDMDAHSRWLLYLGKSSSFDCKVVVYVFSATTRLEHFLEGGDKATSQHRKYKKGQFGFTDDCVICFDDIIDYLTEKDLEKYEPVYKSSIKDIDENELKDIYNSIVKSPKIKFIEKLDIHNNLNNIGVKNLSKPKRQHR